MISRFLSAFLVFLCLVTAAAADTASQAKPQKPTVKKPANPVAPTKAKNPPDYSRESAVLEEYHTAIRYENDGTGERTVAVRAKVQSEAGVERNGQIVIGYNSDNERVDIQYVRVRKPDGSVINTPPDAVQDLTSPVAREAPVYTDFRQKHITVPGLSVGDTLEYNVTIVLFKPLAPGQFWMEHNFIESGIVLDEQLDLNLPKDRVVKLKTRPGFEPKITEQGDRRIYHWSRSHTVVETDAELKKKARRREPEPPAVQLTTFASWQDVGRWYAGLERERRTPTPEIRAKEEELVRGKTSDKDKIEALYDYVALNFRYISLSFGLGRYQPHAASEVLANQYGDCKDKHTLLASLLDAAGFRASSVLINSSRKLDPDVPSPSQFDHVITLVPTQEGNIWLDTTTEVAPYRLLAYPLRDKQALVIAPDGTSELKKTPADSPYANRQVQVVDGKLTDLGKLTIHVSYTLRGDPELLLRTLFRHVPSARWQRMVETMTTMSGLEGAEVTDLKISDPAATHQPFTFECNISKPNFLDWSKKDSQLELPLSQFNLPDSSEPDENTTADAEPLKLGPPGEYIYRLELQLPPKYSARAPLSFDLNRDYAEYKPAYKVENGVFTAERILHIRLSELPSSRSAEYAAFRRAVFDDLKQRLSIENAAAGTPSIGKNISPDELSEAGAAAIDAGNYETAIELLKRAVQLNPQHKAAWNNLGRAYLAERKNDLAATSFRKQIEVNPYDDFAYNNLGRALWADRKYDQAVEAFQKQLNVNPLDKYAHANLGALYLEWHKYDLAAAELEKAISLNSQEPMLYVSLGRAYLNLDKLDQAVSAFDHAVQIAPSPLVWNDIAYELSLKKTHLDQAQRYAESAVASVAAASRNISLAQLRPQDPLVMTALAAYWDTLGWVHFAQADYTGAEKYVSSAWMLAQTAVVGDHLAQIYEKLGEKDRAVRQYALAMNCTRPDPDTRARFAALVGGDDKIDALVRQHGPDLGKARTVQLENPDKAAGTADFFVLLSPGEKNGEGKLASRVEDAKFINGDEKLSSFADQLKATKFSFIFPDTAPAQVLRRGKLACNAKSDCTFALYLLEDVRSIH